MKKEYKAPTLIIHEIHGAMAILDGAATGSAEGGYKDEGSSDMDEDKSTPVRAQSNVWQEW